MPVTSWRFGHCQPCWIWLYNNQHCIISWPLQLSERVFHSTLFNGWVRMHCCSPCWMVSGIGQHVRQTSWQWRESVTWPQSVTQCSAQQNLSDLKIQVKLRDLCSLKKSAQTQKKHKNLPLTNGCPMSCCTSAAPEVNWVTSETYISILYIYVSVFLCLYLG